MYGTKELRADLLAKLNVGDRHLRRLIADRASELPSTNEQALFVLAHENNLKLSRYLTAEQIAEVRGLIQGRPATARHVTTVNGSKGRKTPAKKAQVKLTIEDVDVGTIPALRPVHAAEAKMMAEKVYPKVYFFENSVRDLIETVLRAEFGKDWWTIAVPKGPRDTAAKHLEDEKKDPWHHKRGRRDIDYVFLNDLWAIIKHQWKYFAPLFPDQAWVQTIITRDMNVSRRVLAHMNPLAPDDIANIDTRFKQWVRQLQAVEDKLPS